MSATCRTPAQGETRSTLSSLFLTPSTRALVLRGTLVLVRRIFRAGGLWAESPVSPGWRSWVRAGATWGSTLPHRGGGGGPGSDIRSGGTGSCRPRVPATNHSLHFSPGQVMTHSLTHSTLGTSMC